MPVAALGCCSPFYPYRPVTVLVRSSLNGRPLDDVPVGMSYHNKYLGPIEACGRTGGDGLVALWVTPDDNGQHFFAQLAAEYVFQDVTSAQLRVIPFARWFYRWPFSKSGPPDFVIEVSK
jgi:hypothetical protein